jgi:hypothetical protein
MEIHSMRHDYSRKTGSAGFHHCLPVALTRQHVARLERGEHAESRCSFRVRLPDGCGVRHLQIGAALMGGLKLLRDANTGMYASTSLSLTAFAAP